MKHFNIAFVVNEPLLTTIISLLSGHVKDMQIREIGRTDVVTRRTLNGRAVPISENSQSMQVAKEYLKTLKKGDEFIVTKDLGKALKAAGFKEQSASPLTTQLVRFGLVERVRKGVVKKA